MFNILVAWTLFLNPPEIPLRNRSSCCVRVRFTEPSPAYHRPCCPAPMPAQQAPGQASRVWTHFLLPGVLELSLMCPVCPHRGSPTSVICLHPHRVLRRCSAAGIQSAGLGMPTRLHLHYRPPLFPAALLLVLFPTKKKYR